MRLMVWRDFRKIELVCKEAVEHEKNLKHVPQPEVCIRISRDTCLWDLYEIKFLRGEVGVRVGFRTIVLTEFTRTRQKTHDQLCVPPQWSWTSWDLWYAVVVFIQSWGLSKQVWQKLKREKKFRILDTGVSASWRYNQLFSKFWLPDLWIPFHPWEIPMLWARVRVRVTSQRWGTPNTCFLRSPDSITWHAVWAQSGMGPCQGSGRHNIRKYFQVGSSPLVPPITQASFSSLPSCSVSYFNAPPIHAFSAPINWNQFLLLVTKDPKWNKRHVKACDMNHRCLAKEWRESIFSFSSPSLLKSLILEF